MAGNGNDLERDPRDVHGLAAGQLGVDLVGGDWETLLESARSLTERYAPETAVYPGHGPPTTLGTERESNPFLAELRA